MRLNIEWTRAHPHYKRDLYTCIGARGGLRDLEERRSGRIIEESNEVAGRHCDCTDKLFPIKTANLRDTWTTCHRHSEFSQPHTSDTHVCLLRKPYSIPQQVPRPSTYPIELKNYFLACIKYSGGYVGPPRQGFYILSAYWTRK